MIADVAAGSIVGLVLALVAAGVASGFLAGLLGIGGGGILVPVLYEVLGVAGVDPAIRMHLAVGTALAVILPTSLRSFLAHKARGAVDMGLITSMAPGIVAGVLVGVVIAKYSSREVMQWVWVLSATLMALRLIFKGDNARLGDELPGMVVRTVYATAVGLISTLMSVGGAVYIVMFMTLFGRSMHQAVATSSGFGMLIALPGFLGMAWAGLGVPTLPPFSLGYVSLLGAALIIPASVLAAPLGVRVAHGISKRTLELAFAVLLLTVALRFLIGLIL
jgi:uncharacterized membrane protein YfcA